MRELVFDPRDFDASKVLSHEKIRFVVIPLLFITAISSLLGQGPFGGAEGQLWYSAKILIYAFALCIGLYLRFVMRAWQELFRVLAQGPNAQAEAQLERELRQSKRVAYFYWVVILTVGFLGGFTTFSAFSFEVFALYERGQVVEAALYVVASVALGSAGFEHNLYNYGGTPPVPLSDLNGMSRFWVGAAWLQVYWSGFALMLAVAAYVLWRRGVTTALRPRLATARRKLKGPALGLGLTGLLVWTGSGAWIFYNTNVLNSYVPATEREAQLAAYEKALVHYADLPQPTVTDVTLAVDLFPRETRAVTRGSYRLENRSAAPIAEVMWS